MTNNQKTHDQKKPAEAPRTTTGPMPKDPNVPRPRLVQAPRLREEEVSELLVPVIVGGTFLAYSYVREFHRTYGITRCIVVIADEIKMLTTSRFTDCRIVPDAGEPEGLCRALENIARELSQENPRLVPLALGCDDRHALIFAQNKERLEAAGYVVPCNDYDMLSRISQKHEFYRLCEELDIPYPKTWYFDCSDAGPAALPVDEFTYPLVAKPSDTTQFQNTDVAHKRKAYEVETPEEMTQIWNDIRASAYEGELLVQDYIPGGDDALRILNTFTDLDGNLRVVSGGIVCLQDHSPAALGNPLAIIGEREEAIIRCAERFLKHVGYQGYGNFDLKYDSRTGKFCFFEINIRAGRSTYFTSLGGVSFVSLVVDQYVLGKEIPQKEAYRPFVYCCVPKYVLKRSLTDPDQLKRALALLKQNKLEAYPLNYGPDTLAHKFWSYVMYFNQIRKFKRFYWDTDGKQYRG